VYTEQTIFNMNLKEKDSRRILRSRWEQWVRQDVTQKEERLLAEVEEKFWKVSYRGLVVRRPMNKTRSNLRGTYAFCDTLEEFFLELR
jgi:hypothetical protein